MKDFVGNTITPGCTIVYPVRKGSEMRLKRIKVTQVTSERITGHNGIGRIVHIKNFNTVVVVTPPEMSL
jgi:hypothetical protein